MSPQVKYELQELEVLLASLTEGKRVVKTQTRSWLNNEIDRVKQTFVHEVFSFEDERHLERYIQYHQQALIRLMDKATLESQRPPIGHSERSELFQAYYQSLEELLDFVERHFAKYFDQDAKAPEGYIALAKKDMRAAVRKIQKSLEEANVDSRLLNVVLEVMLKIRDGQADKHLTYRKVMYAKEVYKEVMRLVDRQKTHTNTDEELRQILYYLNYNSTSAITYHAHYISALLEQCDTRAEKIEKLSFLLKTVNQAQVKPGVRFNLHGPALKDQLNNYIIEEIEYQQRLSSLNRPIEGKGTPGFLDDFSLKFDASVAQLAFLLRILMETKIIVNNNLTQLLQFIVRFIATRKAETISYGSFRSKFYNVETGTRGSVRGMLLALINHIDKA